ncbi:alpha-L-fucosidase [Paenibacillus sp. Marseille-Q4541]|uniref:alpha-L-fucosidase n=1 Tax=Paenibacillus sp. Marseille-Q4541 TaxID=2831522 RepID=UPI001BAD112A|nr:alpha-L-fucosidase [Paenibacillus sp. Marseille-Q4541]
MTSNIYEQRIKERNERTAWFQEDRFGMFIHWGLYAIPARGEWLRSSEQMSVEDYQTYFDEFNPVDYKPKEWAKAAKAAGMKYAVLTAKHHDGFCLFDSKLTDYKATNTKAGRDLVREFLDAFREEGIKVGLYFSVIDWHHEDFPAYGDLHHPMKNNLDFKRNPETFPRYLDYMHGQIRELLTDYGKLDIMWFDFSYAEMKGDTWKAEDIIAMLRELQPHIIIDNRLEGSGDNGGSIYTTEPSVYSGDFASPEQIIPPSGVVDVTGKPIPWEACITLNNNWGYAAADKNYKTPTTVIRKLVECVSKNGNMLLNVGPDAKGNIPKESLDILSEVGDWMSKNGDSIYGCKAADFSKPDWGRYTQKGNKLYAHVLEDSVGPVNLLGLNGKIKKARLLADGSELFLSRPWSAAEFTEDAFVSFARPEVYSHPLPDQRNTVIELELVEEDNKA